MPGFLTPITTRSLALASILFTSLAMSKAQEPAPATSPSINGTVIQEPGSQPLKKVLVQIVAEDQKQGGNYSASTDTEGRFHTDNVIPGRYRIFFEKPGFVEVNGHGAKADVNVLTIEAGQSITDLMFRMTPGAIISGRVTDEDGDPMSGVRVLVEKKRPGELGREPAGTDATNDLGEYRIAGLFPGQYVVVAMPPPDFRDYEPRREKAQTQQELPPETRYLTTYYSGTHDSMEASAVVLKAADEMPINFTLVPARTYRVRGVVTGVNSAQKPIVELRSKAGDAYHANADEIGPDGQFEVRGVAPGTYLLQARSSTGTTVFSAHQDVNVVAADLDGIKLTALPSFKLSGRLHIEGQNSTDLTQYSANLHPADTSEYNPSFMPQESFGRNALVDRNGNFQWKNVDPGNYIVQVYGGDGQGFFLKSVALGGRDVATGFSVSGPATIDLVISTKGGTIEGTVTERQSESENGAADDHPVANVTVVAVPEEKYRQLPDRFVNGATDQHGVFTIRGLAPGNYTLYAWQDMDEAVWRDPDFLKSQAGSAGIKIKVEEASNQRINLRLSPRD